MPITFDGLDVTDGALDPESVYVQFICNTGEEAVEHDPTKAPDSRVRPSHAALHGQVFPLSEAAPMPPLDYGCRCAIRYLAKPATAAARVLEPAPEPPTTVDAAYRGWLQQHASGWEQIMTAIVAAKAGEEAQAAYLAAEAAGLTRDIARMVLLLKRR